MKKEITICDCCGEEITDFDVVHQVNGLDLHLSCADFYNRICREQYAKVKGEFDSIVANQDTILGCLERLDREKYEYLFGKYGINLLEETLNKLKR